ncbi:YidH family protein [Telluribacter sp. SYSU D00476]|uniref:YidH family protein n=1 Tax=Telluribacter sp. SYSU D00476 TaxID=2811430 RepID=UPI001FF3A03E|nr:DUF202 domain-containing protein [Telluribacter sp. SYSU D00476]
MEKPAAAPTKIKLSITDQLAVERTHLANERTFLSYFRTSLALLAGGVTILRLDVLSRIEPWGYVFLVIAPIVLSIGLWRFFAVKKRIREHTLTE